jgi:hypothetical protein
MIFNQATHLGGQLVGLGVEHKDGSFDFNWLDKPIHNKIVSGGLDHLLVYNGIDDPNYTYTNTSKYSINLYSWSNNYPNNPRKGVLSFAQCGTDGSPTQFTDIDLKAPIGSKSKSYKSGAPFSGTNADANGYNLRVSYILPESLEDTTVREFAIFGSIKSEAEFPMFARVVLDQPLYLQVGDKPIFTYDLRVDRAVEPVYGDFFGLESADGSPLKFGRKLNYSYSKSTPYNQGVHNIPHIGTSGYTLESSEKAVERPPYYFYDRNNYGYYDRPYVSNSDKSFGVSADSLTSIGDVTGDHGFSFVPYTGVGTNDKYRDIIYTMGLLNPGIVNATDYYDIYFMRIRGMDYRFGYYEEDGTTWHPQALRKFGNQILKFTFRTRYVTEDTVQ